MQIQAKSPETDLIKSKFASKNELEEEDKTKPSPTESTDSPSPFMSWLPYLLIAAILLITRVQNLPFRGVLENIKLVYPNSFNLNMDWNIAYLNLPGILPFALISVIFFAIYKLNKTQIKQIFSKTSSQLSPAIIALLFVLAMVQLMRYTGDFSGNNQGSMVVNLASLITNLNSNLVLLLSPLIGSLGSFITGSATVSNLLFSSIQLETAQLTGLNQTTLLALQATGAAMGNMVSISNILAVSAVAGIKNQEGRILKSTFELMLVYFVLVVVGIGLGVSLKLV